MPKFDEIQAEMIFRDGCRRFELRVRKEGQGAFLMNLTQQRWRLLHALVEAERRDRARSVNLDWPGSRFAKDIAELLQELWGNDLGSTPDFRSVGNSVRTLIKALDAAAAESVEWNGPAPAILERRQCGPHWLIGLAPGLQYELIEL